MLDKEKIISQTYYEKQNRLLNLYNEVFSSILGKNQSLNPL